MTDNSGLSPEVRQRLPFVFMLFSMDVVRPFYALMGAPFAEPQSLQRVLRREIVATRKQAASEDPKPYAAETTLAAISAECGAADAKLISWWTQHLFSDPQDTQIGVWSEVLRIAAQTPESWRELELPAAQAEAARQFFLKSRARDDYWELEASVYSSRLSDWDLHAYAVHLFEDNDPANVRPSSFVSSAERSFSARCFFGYLVRTFSEPELTKFRDQANAIALKSDAMARATPLPLPHTLDIATLR
jgi:hypothetical protein